MIKKEKYSAAILVIGDDILSGRTQDTNSNYIAKEMEMIGINTTQIRVIPDEKSIIIDSVNELRAKNDYLFTTGGIGPTHDDITADSIAEALKVDLEINIEAYDVLEKYYKKIGSEFNDVRQRMARIPKGATLIENSISAAPGFKIKNMRLVEMDNIMASRFYAVHKERPFFTRLCDYMCSGPIIVIELEKENAVLDFRTLIGSTNPEEAEEGTIRKKYATSIEANAIHGSDSDENAQIEIDFFFS